MKINLSTNTLKHMLIVLSMLASPCLAKTVSLNPIADCTVKSEFPETIFANDDLAPYQNGTVGQQGQINLAYVQFQLPQDIDSITQASLTVTQTTNNGVLSYYVYGIYDDIPQADANTYTWNNAPGNQPTNLIVNSTHRYEPSSAIYIAYFPVTRLDPVGQVYEDVLDSSGLSWLADDTDGIITIMIHRRQVLSIVSTLASIENPEFPATKLELAYTSNGSGLGLTITETEQSTEINEENETSDTYTIALNEIPEYDVTITITPGLNTTVSPEEVIFTQANWSEPVEITVTAIDDQIKQETGIYTCPISHTATSSDPSYNGIEIPDVIVMVKDNDLSACGDFGYMPEDLNLDCYVDLQDVAVFLSAWLTCTDPANPLECDIP